MSLEFKFQVDHLNHTLSAVRRALENKQELLGSVGESLLRVNHERHLKELDPDGMKWKALSSLSKFDKRNGGILHKSGRMLNSLKHEAKGDTLRIFFDGYEDSKRAAWHHSGTKPYVIKPKNKPVLAFAGIVTKRVNHPGLPSRKLVGFPDSDRQLTHHVVEDYLTTILKSVR